MSTRGQDWHPRDIKGLRFGIKDLVRVGEVVWAEGEGHKTARLGRVGPA